MKLQLNRVSCAVTRQGAASGRKLNCPASAEASPPRGGRQHPRRLACLVTLVRLDIIYLSIVHMRVTARHYLL